MKLRSVKAITMRTWEQEFYGSFAICCWLPTRFRQIVISVRYDYVVTLKRDVSNKTDLVSFLLLSFSIVCFCFVAIRNGLTVFLIFSIVVTAVGLLTNLFSLRKRKELQFRNWLFVAGICWLGMPFLQWLSLPFLLFAFFEAQAKYPLEIAFDQSGVVVNTFIKKKFPWTSLQSVILKHGLLTLDFKNNKLFQKEVLDDDEPDAPEDEFNDYCQAKLVNSH